MSLPNELLPVGLLSTGDTQYRIERSLRFNSTDSAYLSRTPASAGNRKTWTWSGWVKRSNLGTQQKLIAWGTPTTSEAGWTFNTNDTVEFYQFTNSYQMQLVTTQVFRDVSAWFHLTIAVDTTQATASNRVKIYVNGSEITTFSTSTYPSQNLDTYANSTSHTGYIGVLSGQSVYFNGYLADVHFIDGQALTPSSFAETNTTTGQWVPKAYRGTYGTNGFRLAFADNSSNTATTLGKDSSGNGNNWTPNNLTAGPAFTSNSWSGYFDGSGDNISVPDNNAFTIGSNDFCIEAWIRPTGYTNTSSVIACQWGASGTSGVWQFNCDSSNNLYFTYDTDGNLSTAPTNSVSAAGVLSLNTWQHVAVTRSSTGTRLFVNGILRAYSSTSYTLANPVEPLKIGMQGYTLYRAGEPFQGYISNFRFVNGSIPTEYQTTSTTSGTSIFTPFTTPLTSITNTVALLLQSSTFVDNGPGGYSVTTEGNTRISIDSPFEEFSDTDSFVDTPTSYGTDTGAGGSVRGNYCTWNPLARVGIYAASLSNGNLDCASSGDTRIAYGSIAIPSSGKWFFEVTVTTSSSGAYVGVAAYNGVQTAYPQDAVFPSVTYYGFNGQKDVDGVYSTYGAAYTNAVIGVAVDVDSSQVTFYKDGVSQGVINKSVVGTFPFVGTAGGTYTYVINAGQRPFAYTAPSGFKALCDTNLPTPTIAKGNTAFDIKLWTGNGSTQTISGLAFSPDLVWGKGRSYGGSHAWYDSVRGATKYMTSNTTGAEGTIQGVTAFNSDGFTLGSDSETNFNAGTVVGWCWDAGSSTVTNTQGSITSQVRANASAGFSIVTYTGTGGTATVGHGLGVAPSFVIIKERSPNTDNWNVYHISLGNQYWLQLNTTDGQQGPSSDMWNSTSPSSTVITVRNPGAGGYSNRSGANYVGYFFAPVSGYSSFGSYTGNGSTDGPFVYTGMRPRWILVKNTAGTNNWQLFDTARNNYNVVDRYLQPNASSAESTSNVLDILSNGFKIRDTLGNWNGSGNTITYAAFAESPLQYSRAR